jgi:MFS family permease
MSYHNLLNLVVIFNGVSIPARILPGYTGDTHIGMLNTLIICLLGNSIILWSWLAVSSTPAYCVFAVLYGLVGAAFQSLIPTTIASYSNDIMKTGTRLGMAFTTIGFSALLGEPISGALLKASGGWYGGPICGAAATTCVGTALIVAARV